MASTSEDLNSLNIKIASESYINSNKSDFSENDLVFVKDKNIDLSYVIENLSGVNASINLDDINKKSLSLYKGTIQDFLTTIILSDSQVSLAGGDKDGQTASIGISRNNDDVIAYVDGRLTLNRDLDYYYDNDVVPKKYIDGLTSTNIELIPDENNICTWVIDNTLKTSNVVYFLRETESGHEVKADVFITANNITIKFTSDTIIEENTYTITVK